MYCGIVCIHVIRLVGRTDKEDEHIQSYLVYKFLLAVIAVTCILGSIDMLGSVGCIHLRILVQVPLVLRKGC